jgi:hypothetical protein
MYRPPYAIHIDIRKVDPAMLKKTMKTVFKVLAIVIVLAALFFGYVGIRPYIDDWKNEQQLLKHTDSTDYIGRQNAFKKELMQKNNSIVRVDIYTALGYLEEGSSKSLDEFQMIGTITDEKELKRFRKCFKRIASSNRTSLRYSVIPDIWINIIYEDGSNVVAEIAGGNDGGMIRIHDYKVDEIPGKSDHNYIALKMPGKLWEIIKNNIIPDYKNRYKSY